MQKLLTIPTPLRVGALVSLGVFLISFICLVLFSGQRVAIASSFELLGVDGFIFGTILATNYRGSASAYSGLWEVEAARWWLHISTPLFGAASIVLGVVFVTVSVLSAFAHTT